MEILRQCSAIAFVFALLAAALYALRKKGKVQFRMSSGSERSLLQLRGRLTLSAQHSVCCVRMGEREFLLAVHPSGISLLAEDCFEERRIDPETRCEPL